MGARLLAAFSYLLPALLLSTPATAQDSTHTTQEYRVAITTPIIAGYTALEPVAVYSARSTSPFTFLNLSGAQLQARSTGQELALLLAATPSITAYTDAGSGQGYAYYRLRGIDQTRINTTLDGVPLNEPEDQGAYFSNYPDLLNSVSSVQIQRGVGLSKNGVASFGGSVNLASPNLNDSLATAFGAGYGSFQSLRLFAKLSSGTKQGRALHVRVSEIYSGGYKRHASNHSQSAFVSAGFNGRGSQWKLNVIAGRQQNELAWIGVADSLIDRDSRANANSPRETDAFFQAHAQLHHYMRLAPRLAVSSAAYATFLDGGYRFDLANFLQLPPDGSLYRYAFQSQGGGAFTHIAYAGRRLNLAAGLHGSLYERTHTGSEQSLGRLYQNTGHKPEWSAFAHAAYTIARLTFTGEVQYRHAAFRYDGSTPLPLLRWNFLNPKAGITYRLQNPGLQASRIAALYYSVGLTGREPTRNDLFLGSDDLPADSLGRPVWGRSRPERVIDHEAGARYQSAAWTISANLFYMRFRNEIVLNGAFGPNGLALTDAVDRSHRAGLEWSIVHVAAMAGNSRFTFTDNGSLNQSRIQSSGVQFSPVLTPRFIINQAVDWQRGKWSAGLNGRYQSSSYLDFANSRQIPAYLVFGATAGWAYRHWDVRLFLNNLTNRRYYNHGYVEGGTRRLFVQAPFNGYLALRYTL